MEKSVKLELGILKDASQKRKHKFEHLHGYLNFEINGRSVPYMGYWGEDDVCLNDWLHIFMDLRLVMKRNQKTYLFDDCEQGQPAYLFEVISENSIQLSVVDSECGDGLGDPEWQKVPFTYVDFEAEFLKLKKEFLAKIADIAPKKLHHWTLILGYD